MTESTSSSGEQAETQRGFWAVLVAIWSYVFPPLEYRTDRVVRRLLITDLIFLIYVSVMAYDSAVVFTAFVAANAVGAIGGLLFAVPKQASVKPGATGPGIAIIANTSLEEVSDWLTKTIIGAGLVSWRQILGQLDYSGRVVGHAITRVDGDVAWAGGVALILGPSALGALIAYLWFARHWPSELAGSTVSAHKIFADAGLVQERERVAPDKPNIPPPATPQPAEPREPPPASTEAVGFALETAVAEDEGAVTETVEAVSVETEAKRRPPETPTAAIRLREAAELKYAKMRSEPLYRHDWARGMFGGSSNVTNSFGTRALSASVRKLTPDWFEIKLQVTANPRPETETIFFLHDTFRQPTPTAGFDAAGVAQLKIKAYGAFTVGMLTDDGTTELELNLAGLEAAPTEFRNR